jgi:polysaccharide export outer membrane protein
LAVPVGGLSTPEAERKVAQLLRDKGYMKDPQVNILVTTVNSQLVSVIGQVNKGRIVLDNGRTVTDMVASAGGVTPDGGDMVTLIRNENGNSVKYQIDLYELSHGVTRRKTCG